MQGKEGDGVLVPLFSKFLGHEIGLANWRHLLKTQGAEPLRADTSQRESTHNTQDAGTGPRREVLLPFLFFILTRHVRRATNVQLRGRPEHSLWKSHTHTHG